MRLAIGLWSLLFYASLLIWILEQSSARKTTIRDKKGTIKDHDPSSHLHHVMMNVDPSVNVFFTPNDLKIGKTIPIYFSEKNHSVSPRLLSKEESDSIPFSLSELPNLLDYFSFPKDSPQAKAMEYTLTQCQLEPIKGETRFCATTLESMLDFASDTFGSGVRFRVLTTTHLKNPTALLQNYTVLGEPKEIVAQRMIGCHTMPYPYAVYYCHSQGSGSGSENKVFEVSLVGEYGERVEAAAVCHMDTSRWDSDHVSFHVLGVEPGSSPVCHFFPSDNLVWVPLPSSI
ncbi:BURP domain containing protein [Trema orientale]|uniref:BURP domain containing protein n=1 Tax=Trema orientale TaxID=63057 RepID=A0A2P5EHA0_TREOI|nr:BURP domain containing protein [Trema orientale]